MYGILVILGHTSQCVHSVSLEKMAIHPVDKLLFVVAITGSLIVGGLLVVDKVLVDQHAHQKADASHQAAGARQQPKVGE